jgi:hypothetical protein
MNHIINTKTKAIPIHGLKNLKKKSKQKYSDFCQKFVIAAVPSTKCKIQIFTCNVFLLQVDSPVYGHSEEASGHR